MPSIFRNNHRFGQFYEKFKKFDENRNYFFIWLLCKKGIPFYFFLYVFVSLAFVSSVSASSHQIDLGEQIPEKYKEVLEGALTGDVNSQMKLGLLYYSGVGLDKNHNLALQWFEQAADNGHASAHYMLSLIHISEPTRQRQYRMPSSA